MYLSLILKKRCNRYLTCGESRFFSIALNGDSSLDKIAAIVQKVNFLQLIKNCFFNLTTELAALITKIKTGFLHLIGQSQSRIEVDWKNRSLVKPSLKRIAFSRRQ